MPGTLPGGTGGGLTPGQRRQLELYLDILYGAQPALKLTRVPREEAWSRHVEESLDLLRAREWHAGETVLDLGSGGGVPGIPLAVARQELRVVLVERSRARAAFLLSSLGQLGLGGVRVLARDAAELAGTGEVSGVDVMVSRAAVPPPRLLGLAARLLRPGGEGLVHVGSSFWDRGTAADLAPLFPTLTGLRVEAVGGSHLLRFAARLSR